VTGAARAAPWPVDLRFNKARAELLISFDDGVEFTLPYELLRVESPSAETKGHGSENPPPPEKKRRIDVTGAEPVGRYALRIQFSDGHNTGLYTWAYLRELAEQKDQRMSAYVARMKELRLSRE
jgi:DUF971 family protein